MSRILAFVLILRSLTALAQAPNPAQPPPGWLFGTEGSGIPVGQEASEYAVQVERTVVHGGGAAITLRSVVEKPATFRAVTQFIKADAYRGKRVRLAGHLKLRDVADWCGLWLRVDGPGNMLGFDNMGGRGLKGTADWARHEIVLDVPEAAAQLAFGAVLTGTGQVWADDLTLEVVDAAIPSTQPPGAIFNPKPVQSLSNLDFEAGGVGNDVPGWVFDDLPSGSHRPRVVEVGAHGGRKYLRIEPAPGQAPTYFSAYQAVVAGPYAGKRVRFRVYLKTEGVDKEAFANAWINAGRFADYFAAKGRGARGDTDWRPQDLVFDVPDGAEWLAIAVDLPGGGSLGIDDVSLEVVDPNTPVSPEVEPAKATRAQREKEAAEAIGKLPGRPENLDFER